MLKVLTYKEAVIISLKLGMVSGKYFSTEEISKFLGIEPSEVLEITSKILLLHKNLINNAIEHAIETVSIQSNKEKK